MKTTIEISSANVNTAAASVPLHVVQGERLSSILHDCDFDIVGQAELAGKKPVFAAIPNELHETVRNILEKGYPDGLYSHQSAAITASLGGKDVCLATPTSSGKSLIFMSLGLHELLSDPDARVLVLYPTKALIQDQLAKWKTMLAQVSMEPGFIDGSVRTNAVRNDILLNHRIVLMTPDVAHAWMMANLNEPGVAMLRKNLRLLILDEAHVYDGVFGTNMAFFLRRLQAVTSKHRLICATATLGKPLDFIFQLTGRHAVEIGRDYDGARAAAKTIYVVQKSGGDSFTASVELIRELACNYPGRFLVFGDSRKGVELLTAASLRNETPSTEEAEAEPQVETNRPVGVLPYRSGYEATDRREIQEALTNGTLRGVVSTSALELGLDIGEIDLVILLDSAPSMKSFWQRLGRVGRKNAGICVIVDNKHVIGAGDEALSAYLARPVEPNWLYLENRYAQYANALCAAAEIGQINGSLDQGQFASLPTPFVEFLDNELNPVVPVPTDLYPFKQLGQAGAHREFPLRSGMEKNFKVATPAGEPRGELGYSQVMREAYPGAVYYYMAEPFRVRQLKYRDGQIVVTRERRYTTQPTSQIMVFPDFQTAPHHLAVGPGALLAEVEMQVSERVTGFKEKRGQTETAHTYAPGSPYSQQPIMRFIRTTGVCWYSEEAALLSEEIILSVLHAFCVEYGIQARDVGSGRFHAKQSPLGSGEIKGACIFDNNNGSLRLTERLAENFGAVVQAAMRIEEAQGNYELCAQLKKLLALVDQLTPTALSSEPNQNQTDLTSTEEWVHVIAPGEKAIFTSSAGQQEVTVVSYVYTPKGLQYHLVHSKPGVRWMVEATSVEPIVGLTKTISVNLMTGEEQLCT